MDDITIIGAVVNADGVGNHSPMLIDTLCNNLSINALQMQPIIYNNISSNAMKVYVKPFKEYGKTALYVNILGLNEQWVDLHKKIESTYKIALSMFEGDQIPKLWVNILNSYYDIVVVSDQYFIDVYKKSGVNIPIFVIPLGIKIEEFLKQPIKIRDLSKPFIFGMSAGFYARKNHLKLLNAFAKKFGNNSNFKLKLHGRNGPQKNLIEQTVKNLNLSNVELLTNTLSPNDYLEFMKSLDCYIYPSVGEGFSISPRESLALGIPVIVSNNTAHHTICDSGYVASLKSNIKIPAKYELFKEIIGNQFDCVESDLIDKMDQVNINYDYYLALAKQGKEWTKQYLWKNLQKTYLNLLKPKNIIYSDINKVDETSFKTNNKKLFNKLKILFP